MSLVSTSMDVKRSQAHKICFMNTCWPNKRPRDPCIFLSQLVSAASQHTTFHEIWPRGNSCPCVSPPRGKITWATYTKGLFLLEGLYNFNIPVAFFSETNSENPWDRRHMLKSQWNPSTQKCSFLLSSHLCWTAKHGTGHWAIQQWQDYLPLRTWQASGREIITIDYIYLVLSI